MRRSGSRGDQVTPKTFFVWPTRRVSAYFWLVAEGADLFCQRRTTPSAHEEAKSVGSVGCQATPKHASGWRERERMLPSFALMTAAKPGGPQVTIVSPTPQSME